jgi:hypothetical protein
VRLRVTVSLEPVSRVILTVTSALPPETKARWVSVSFVGNFAGQL